MIIKKTTVNVNGTALEYVLEKTDALYSIEISERSDGKRKVCRFNDIARSKEAAIKLFRLLSENSVCTTTAPYVLDDLAESVTFC